MIQAPNDLQSYNRYAYVRNNPLTLTDPSGFSWWSKHGQSLFKQIGLAIVTGGASLVVKATDKSLKEFGRFARKNKFVAEITQIVGCAAVTVGTGGWGAAACGAISSAVTYGVTDGDLRAAARSGAVAFSTTYMMSGMDGKGGINSWGSKSALEVSKKVIAAGMVGGTMSVASGGKFGRGFTIAALSQGLQIGLKKYIESANMTNSPKYSSDVDGTPTYEIGSGIDLDKAKWGAYVTDSTKNNIGIARKLLGFAADGKTPTLVPWDGTVMGGANTLMGYLKDTPYEGSWFMEGANKVPGMNYMSVFHDTWAGHWGMGVIPGATMLSILPAIPISYAGLGMASDYQTYNLLNKQD